MVVLAAELWVVCYTALFWQLLFLFAHRIGSFLFSLHSPCPVSKAEALTGVKGMVVLAHKGRKPP